MTTRAPALRFAFSALILAAGSLVQAANFAVNSLELVTHGAVDPSSGLYGQHLSRLRTPFQWRRQVVRSPPLSISEWRPGERPFRPRIPRRVGARATCIPSSRPRRSPQRTCSGCPWTRPISSAISTLSVPVTISFRSLEPRPSRATLRGPMIYPNGIGDNPNRYWDGIHATNGTGFRLGTSPRLSDNFVSYPYMYQDLDIGPGSWSSDLRALVNFERVKLEVFAGATVTPGYSDGLYRSGLMFYATSGDVGEFFAQVGVPHWDPTGEFLRGRYLPAFRAAYEFPPSAASRSPSSTIRPTTGSSPRTRTAPWTRRWICASAESLRAEANGGCRDCSSSGPLPRIRLSFLH